MKKEYSIKGVELLIPEKLWLKMKLITILLFLVTCCLQANNTYSQNVTVNLNLVNATLTEVFREIEKQSDYRFFFNSTSLSEIKRQTVKTENMTLPAVLEQLFKGTDIHYKLVDKYIVITSQKDHSDQSSQQNDRLVRIVGVVKDETGEPIIGVNVSEKGTTNGTITDMDGKFSLGVPNTAVLRFSYIGYLSQDLTIKGKTSLDVTLKEDSQNLEEVVVVGYGTQKKVNLTGAIAAVNSKDLTVAPVANTTNALAGRLPGLTVIQKSGRPGSDGSDLNIRSFGKPLVIVDGVEAAFNTIDPNIIESISVLKDGSAAIYGSRAGNGVILVTTKRGVSQKPMITFSGNLTLQGVTSMPRTVNAGQYAELMTEKWLNEGRDPGLIPYTQEQIGKYYAGNDPQYPNTNWYEELVKNWTPMQQYNVSIRGGSEKIKYYGFIGYMNQKSMWKKNGGGYERYNLQSNIDASINKNLSFLLDLAAIIESDICSVRSRNNAEWADFWSTLPTAPATLPDPTKISYADGAGTGGAHVSTNYELYGRDKRDNQNFKGTGTMIYKVPGVEGLTAKVLVNAIVNYNKISKFSKPVNFYTYDVASDTYTLAASLGNKAQLEVEQRRNFSIMTQASLNYERVFAGVHNFSALLLFEGINYNSDFISAGRDNFLSPSIEQLYAGDNSTAKNNGTAEEGGRMSYVGRVNYSYKDKYLFEATLRADASAKFSPTKRWGYFPSVSAAWRISEESFMDNVSYLDNLKLRVNYGQSGNDDVVNFQYLSGYKLQGFAGYLIGDNPMKAIYSSVIPNPNLSWEEIKIMNGGIDFSFLNKKIYGEIDGFYRKRTGIPGNRNTSLPSTFGASLPQENINSMDNRGFELTLGSHFEINDFMFDISGNIAWARDKWIHYEEPEYTDPDDIRMNKKSGNWSSRLFGYQSDKLFGSQSEINALPFQQDNNKNSSLRPGDVRYMNTNGDELLDWRDKVELGANYPHWTMGFNINTKYKNFDLTALFQGAFAYYTDVWLLRQTTKVYSEQVYDLRWSEENNNVDALVPRIGGSNLNAEASDYRYKKAGYLRLKNASLGYNIPKSLLSKLYIEQARVSVSGTNLFTFDKLKKYHVDPEAPFGEAGYYYPQQRTVSFGINVTF